RNLYHSPSQTPGCFSHGLPGTHHLPIDLSVLLRMGLVHQTTDDGFTLTTPLEPPAAPKAGTPIIKEHIEELQFDTKTAEVAELGVATLDSDPHTIVNPSMADTTRLESRVGTRE